MNERHVILLLQYLLLFLGFNSCKQNIDHKQLYITELMMDQILLSSQVYNSFSLPDSFKKNVFLYRYSEDICEVCIFEDLENLKILQKKIGKDRIFVLSAFSNYRQNKVRKHYELRDFNNYNISSDSLVVPVHKTEGSKPYFAIMNSDGKLEMVFFPKKGYSSNTREYFKEVEKRLQLNN